MRWPLDILDVLVLLEGDATVVQLGIADHIFAVVHRACSSPVPVESSHVLETRHLLISKVRDDLEHVATVAIETEHVVVNQVIPPDCVLEEERGADESSDDPLGLHGICKEKLLHNINLILFILYSLDII